MQHKLNLTPSRPLQENNIKEDTEIGTKIKVETYLPGVECQMSKKTVAINPEELPVIEENKTTIVDKFIEHEMRNEEIDIPAREDNLPQKRITETVELPACMTTRSDRVSKQPGRLRDYVCNEVINKITLRN